MPEVDYEGTFMGIPYEWGIVEFNSGAKAIQIGFLVKEFLDGESKTFQPWSGPAMTAHGAFFTVLKSGEWNEKTEQLFTRVLQWNGRPSGLKENPPEVLCKFGVKKDSYKDQVSYRIKWFGLPNDPGGGMKAANELDSMDAEWEAIKLKKPLPAKDVPNPLAAAPATGSPFDQQASPF